MRATVFFGAKNFRFFEIYGVSARTTGEGVEPVRTFFGQERGGQFFEILYGRLCARPLNTFMYPQKYLCLVQIYIGLMC